MATKNDLIEAQNFSRRRLLTAFVSGAPGGKELEPAAPLRAVFAAIALTAAVLLVGLFWGFLQPGLPKGWENGRLVLAKDTGARYVTQNGVLHPVINTASARLLIPASEFRVVSTDSRTLAGVELGSTLGILGAPDELPASSALVNDGWTACVTDDGGTDVRVAGAADVDETPRAVVADNGGTRYVIAGEMRYAVDEQQSDAVLRAAGITTLAPVDVATDWLNLYTPGDALTPIVVPDAGLPLADTDLLIGAVVHITGNPDDERYLVHNDGTLAELPPLAWQLYQLGSGRNSNDVQEVSSVDVGGLRTSATPAGGADWPSEGFASIGARERPCALLTHDDAGPHTVLGTQPDGEGVDAGVHVDAAHGALVRSGGRGDQGSDIITLIDATGTSYGLPGATDETVNRLGYRTTDVGSVDESWIGLFAAGPALTEDAAGRDPGAAQG